MFHFWFNTFFVSDEETAVLECEVADASGDSVSPTYTKMSVTRTQSDQARPDRSLCFFSRDSQ